MTTSALLSVFSSVPRKRLLAYFFGNPERQLYLRQIARQIKADPGNLSRELKRLEEEGIFQSEKRGNQTTYRLNVNYPLYAELKSIIGKTIGVQGALAELLKGIPGIKRAFIYGSFAKGTEKAHSDIDVCLIVEKGKFKEDRLLIELKHLEETLGREISYIFYTEQEWTNGLKKEDSFMVGVDKGKKIELIAHG